MLSTLIDDWDEMTAEERRRVVDFVFAEIHASSEGIAKILPREDWNPTWLRFYARPSRWNGGVRSGRRGSSTRKW
jgi:hypothetical protein